ncbi:MAG: isopeptide-forming domain-containing fimbrial protein [Sharpea porci]
MNHLKKLLGYIVTMAMVFTLTGVGIGAVHAENGYTLTLKNNGLTSHTFEVYQVFTGDLNENTLSNIQWGNGITKDGQSSLGSASVKAKSLEGKNNDSDEAKAFAESIQQYLTNPVASKEVTAGASVEVTINQAGYYLVKDKLKDGKSTQDGVEKGATTAYILKIVKSTIAETKLDVPTVTKKVKDHNESTGVDSGWQDSADYGLNDTIPYQITGTLHSKIADYKTYKYVFTDTMSKGLTFNSDAKITIGGTDVTNSFIETVRPNDDGSTTVTWSCDNLKGISGVTVDASTKVIVNYTAKLNENAVMGSKGNPNTVKLTYSNNPNNGGEGETGTTPEDKNIVFTYKTVVNKVNDNNEALAGAEFTLTKKVKDGEAKTIAVVKNDVGTIFTFNHLDDGEYTLTETKTPAGYNTIAPITFTISAEHETESDNPSLTSLTGTKKTGEITFTSNTADGSLTTDIVNKKGSELPETGGMGTTLLYVLGGVLVALAAAYVIYTKKHEKAE